MSRLIWRPEACVSGSECLSESKKWRWNFVSIRFWSYFYPEEVAWFNVAMLEGCGCIAPRVVSLQKGRTEEHHRRKFRLKPHKVAFNEGLITEWRPILCIIFPWSCNFCFFDWWFENGESTCRWKKKKMGRRIWLASWLLRLLSILISVPKCAVESVAYVFRWWW